METTKKDKTVASGIRLPHSLKAKLEKIAKKERRSFNWICAEALAQYVKKAA